MTMAESISPRRPVALRRSWLFVPGLNVVAQQAGLASGPDALVADLEEFTIPADRPAARQRIVALLSACRARGIVAAVRINTLAGDGYDDLQAVMPGAPDAILLPHSESAAQIQALDAALTGHEAACQLPVGNTEIVPVLESALGVHRALDILTASPRVSASLLAAEDLTANLGAERGRDGLELSYLRQRFLVDCTAARCLPIDCPYNYLDEAALLADLRWARRIGFKSRCSVYAAQIATIHGVLTPAGPEVAAARALLARVQEEGDAAGIAAPDRHTAQRLLARHAQFVRWAERRSDP